MMLRDCRDLPVSGADRTALDGYERAATMFARYQTDPLAEIDPVIAAAPDFAMAHCFRAGLMLCSTERAAEPELRRSIEAVEALHPRTTERERGHAIAARAWLEGDFRRAGRLYGEVLARWPRDLLALQLAHQIDFFTGNATALAERPARCLDAWGDAPGRSYVSGMHAFGLEETDRFPEAERAGRAALDGDRRDAWAVHAVGHVMEMQGRTGEGIDFLRDRVADWSEDNMLAFHNWWHLALYHLEHGETEAALGIYDRNIRPRPSAVALEMVDASAMLWRLRLRGVSGGGRWAELADSWAPMADDGYYAFNDAHATMAFVGANRFDDAKRLVKRLESVAAGSGDNAMMTRDVGLPLCRGLLAFGEGDWREAVDALAPVRAVAHRAGGSNAQRDVISLTLLEAALRAGDGAMARRLAAERLARKPESPLAWGLTRRAGNLPDGGGVMKAA